MVCISRRHVLYDMLTIRRFSEDFKELREQVDLDQVKNKKPGKKPDVHRVVLRQTKKVDFASLDHYLSSQGKVGGQDRMPEECLEALSESLLLQEVPH